MIEKAFEAWKKFRDDIFTRHQALAFDFQSTDDFEDKFRAHLIERRLKHSGTHATRRSQAEQVQGVRDV